MPVVKLPDGAGNTLTVTEVDGHYFPTFPDDVIRGVPDLKLLDDDILIAGYPKSGTHWLWEIVYVFLAGKCEDSGMEKDSLMLELTSHEELAKIPSPRILNTHVPFSMIPKEVFEKKTKILYLTRNPKDLSVSFYNHHKKLPQYYDYHGTFKQYLPLWLGGKVDYGSWFDYIKSWKHGLESHPDIPTFNVTYEDMREDPLPILRKLALFLGKTYDDAFLKEVEEWCALKSMRKRKGKYDLCSDGQPIMYRKGEVGDWKNWFTVADNEMFDGAYKDQMSDVINMTFRYTL